GHGDLLRARAQAAAGARRRDAVRVLVGGRRARTRAGGAVRGGEGGAVPLFGGAGPQVPRSGAAHGLRQARLREDRDDGGAEAAAVRGRGGGGGGERAAGDRRRAAGGVCAVDLALGDAGDPVVAALRDAEDRVLAAPESCGTLRTRGSARFDACARGAG